MGRGGRRSTSFRPGQSGNPSGLPKTLRVIEDRAEAKRIIADVKAAAREFTADALQKLHAIMMDESAPHAAQLGAAREILDRGWGKPTQTIESDVGPTLADLVLQSYRGRTALPAPAEALTLESSTKEENS
ncbi:MAG TPA: DUF5681 domain-containing protein [Roseiarcus sp.]|nr:DUF5681 domain-containing protein [Roseiarcus sp.]